jgi:hypothetical protein
VAFIFTAEKPCSLRACAAAAMSSGPVAADPGVGPDAIAHLAAEHLVSRDVVVPALEVPQRLVEPGQRRHQHRPAAVEAAAIGDLPDILDPARVGADEAVADRLKGTVHRFGMAFQARLAPSNAPSAVSTRTNSQRGGTRKVSIRAIFIFRGFTPGGERIKGKLYDNSVRARCAAPGPGTCAAPAAMSWREGYIAVDWGTTNRRAYLIDSAGRLADEFADDLGLMAVPKGGFDAAAAQIRERLGDRPMLLAGWSARTAAGERRLTLPLRQAMRTSPAPSCGSSPGAPASSRASARPARPART